MIFPEKSVICSHFFILFFSCRFLFYSSRVFEKRRLQELHCGDAKSLCVPQVGTFLPHPTKQGNEEGSKLGSPAENLWGVGSLSTLSDGGETRKQPWHLQAGADFARAPAAQPNVTFWLPRNGERGAQSPGFHLRKVPSGDEMGPWGGCAVWILLFYPSCSNLYLFLGFF